MRYHVNRRPECTRTESPLPQAREWNCVSTLNAKPGPSKNSAGGAAPGDQQIAADAQKAALLTKLAERTPEPCSEQRRFWRLRLLVLL